MAATESTARKTAAEAEMDAVVRLADQLMASGYSIRTAYRIARESVRKESSS